MSGEAGPVAATPAKLAELVMEGEYLHDARNWREQRRDHLSDPAYALAGADAKAQAALRRQADAQLAAMQPPSEPAAFGRIDLDDGTTYYVGRENIFDGGHDVVVLDWRRAEGRLFEQATVLNTCGLTRKRTFAHKKLELIDFDDLIFSELIARVEELEAVGHVVDPAAMPVSDSLMEELDRSRGGEMHDIVRTIQAAQSELIRSDIERLLIVQGGPGTGKTAVALHRVSWILFNSDLDEGDILVIGPNRTFLRYIEKVLPALGNIRVPQSDVQSLGTYPAVVDRTEDDDLARLKGSAVMAGVLERALLDRIRIPESDLMLSGGGRRTTISRGDIEAELSASSTLSYAERRGRFSDWLGSRAAQSVRGDTSIFQDSVSRAVEQILPRLTANSFLTDLFGSRDRLLRAASEDLNAKEVQSLYRQAAGKVGDEPWTPADVPLLDYADKLISSGQVKRYRHIVVDEAQDLSPMQLKMIARRSENGAMTIVGDIAQSTGLFARDNWADVAGHLRGGCDLVEGELRYGYRVPRQAFLLAEGLLPHIAPGVTAPIIVREGPQDPELLHESSLDLVRVAVEAARRHAGSGRSVGLICPDSQRDELEDELDQQGVQYTDASTGVLGAAISLVSPSGSKGLEFDAVVVVDPEAIVESGTDGYRLLYVALTRTTKYLTIVHTGTPVPRPDGLPPQAQGRHAEAVSSVVTPMHQPAPRRATARVLAAAAEEVIELLREIAPPHLWAGIIDEARERLRDHPESDT